MLSLSKATVQEPIDQLAAVLYTQSRARSVRKQALKTHAETTAVRLSFCIRQQK